MCCSRQLMSGKNNYCCPAKNTMFESSPPLFRGAPRSGEGYDLPKLVTSFGATPLALRATSPNLKCPPKVRQIYILYSILICTVQGLAPEASV